MKTRLIALAIVFLATPAFAWNKGGHMVSGSIAHAVLKAEHPGAIAKVVAILKQHPQYDTWAKRIAEVPTLTAEQKDDYLFMLAARWADDIRSDEAHHHGDWHFINLPYMPGGKADGIAPPQPRPDNIVRAYELNRGLVKTGKSEEKAIALCWVFHLIGDCHQPLHTSSYYSKDYPKGDKGGNLVYIRVREQNQPINLHEFWDDLVTGSDRVQGVRSRATELRVRPEFAKPKLTELKAPNFEHWIKDESFKLVDEAVYRRGKVTGSPHRDKAPVLPDDYIKVTKPIAERRIVLAGYRIAEVVHQLVD